MASRIYLPECLLAVYSYIFPTVDFARIDFYLGPPWPLGSKSGFTCPSSRGMCTTNLYLRQDLYDPCSKETFLLIAHELVHALQIQQRGCGLGLFNWFVISYLTCLFSTFSSERTNPLEREAYDFANGPIKPGDPMGKLRQCIEYDSMKNPSLILPCDCNIPWLGLNPTFLNDLTLRCSDALMSESQVSIGECLLSGWMIFWYLIALVVAFVISLVGGILAFIFGNIWDFFSGLPDFFTGGGVGVISLLFSQDGGISFRHKTTLESTSEPPALASDGTGLFICWIGGDNMVNVINLPWRPGIKASFEQSNDDAGPALAYVPTGPSLAFVPGKMYSVWQDEDNHLHLKASDSPPSGFVSASRLDLGEDLAADATPALAYGNGIFCLGWIGENNHIYIKTSVNGINWGMPHDMNETSPDDGTPALTYGNGMFYLAWTGDDDDNHLYIKSFTLSASEMPVVQSRSVLPQRSSDDAGPALVFAQVSGAGRLFIAWTDDNQQMHVMFSTDPKAVTWQNDQILGHSSDNAGPAMAIGPMGIVSVAWVDKNGSGGWISLAGQWSRIPVVANNADGTLHIFITGQNEQLYHRWQTSPNGGWNDRWESLGGSWDGNPVVGKNADGRLEIFIVGQNEQLYHSWQTSPNSNTWNRWESLGGSWNSSSYPSVANNADGTLHIFITGQNEQLYHRWQTSPNNGWA